MSATLFTYTLCAYVRGILVCWRAVIYCRRSDTGSRQQMLFIERFIVLGGEAIAWTSCFCMDKSSCPDR